MKDNASITIKTVHGKIYHVAKFRDRHEWMHTPMHRMLNHALDSVERHNKNPVAVKEAKDRYLGITRLENKTAANSSTTSNNIRRGVTHRIICLNSR